MRNYFFTNFKRPFPIQSGSIKSEKVIPSVKLNFPKERILPQVFMLNGNPAIVAHHGKCTSD